MRKILKTLGKFHVTGVCAGASVKRLMLDIGKDLLWLNALRRNTSESAKRSRPEGRLAARNGCPTRLEKIGR
jgi:hypothetical protein